MIVRFGSWRQLGEYQKGTRNGVQVIAIEQRHGLVPSIFWLLAFLIFVRARWKN
jgi:hypothetical protein